MAPALSEGRAAHPETSPSGGASWEIKGAPWRERYQQNETLHLRSPAQEDRQQAQALS
jgi:hypothetical protein